MVDNITMQITANIIPESIWYANLSVFMIVFLAGIVGYYGFHKSIIGVLIFQSIAMIIGFIFYPYIVSFFTVS